jgi:hypothetical protein
MRSSFGVEELPDKACQSASLKTSTSDGVISNVSRDLIFYVAYREMNTPCQGE